MHRLAFTLLPPEIPKWATTLIWVTTALTALGVVWSKVVRPGFKVASAADQMIPLLTQLTKVLAAMPEMLPLLQELTKALGGEPNAAEILNEIVEQVRNDHGSSLHDTIDKLFILVTEAKRSAEAVATQLTLTSKLEERSQAQVVMLGQQVALLLGLVDRLGGAVQSGARDAAVVATELAASQERADKIASNPAAPAGAAADGAAGSAPGAP